ncbi:MAG: HlyD family efflux transporter periplasmic adaptor subunit [Lachnospiraceae bacterium]|nr:HlyD family efflux transporter periplasmic adaptor subunit [Lachnospiraceae bacterium]
MAEKTGKKAVSRAERRRRGKQKKLLAAGLVVLLVLGGSIFAYDKTRRAKETAAQTEGSRTAVAERRDIVSQLSSSGTLSPKDTYEITSLVEGEVVAADFEEGDQVEKGQVLYQIDATSMESEVLAASNSLIRAQESYADALKDQEEALSDYGGSTYKATKSGYIKKLYIDVGDKVGGNSQICDIYDDQTMEIRLPFLSGEAAAILPGSGAILTLTDTGEQLPGAVISVSAMEEVLAGGTLVRDVTIQVANPGGLTTDTAATAAIGDFLCAQEGYFEAKVDTVMSADLESSVEVEALLVSEGSYIAKGTPIFLMTARSSEKIIKSYQDALDKAQESVENAQNKLDSTQDSYEDYTIAAPISGQVITKTSKLGDNISRSNNGSTTMAVIYDLSALTFEMSIDELDIQNVEVGQKVVVTADAFEGQTFNGTVTNVSLQSTAANGVTVYPVTVTMDEVGSLLPGMNVDGTIILDEAKDTLSIPIDSLMRGDRVYIKDDTVKEQEGPVPAGFRAVEVVTGLISDDYVEIISGLEEGQEVYVDASSQSTGFEMMMPGGMGGGPGGGGMPRGGPSGGGMPGGGRR